MIINFDKLVNEGIKELNIEENMMGFDVDTFKIKDLIKYEGKVRIDGDEGKIKLEIKYTFNDNCDRCLREISKEELISFNRSYLIKEEKSVDLDKEVKESILLNKPSKVLCNIDCKGLCDKCGKNLNDGPCECEKEEINPKFEKLKELLNK